MDNFEDEAVLHDTAANTSHIRPMFGDPFEARGDYSKGFFYKGRRSFLHDNKESVKVNHLEPPEIFMTKQQKRRIFLASRGTELGLKKFEFTRLKNDSEGASGAKKEKIQGKKKKKKDIQYIEKFSSVKEEDWTIELQAGCKIYVNHNTGEVSDECPWDPENSLHATLSPSKSDASPGDEGEVLGTGSTVYDPKDLNEVLAFLDIKSK